MARNLIPALVLSASAVMLPVHAITDTDNQEQFVCDVREFIHKNIRYKICDCLDDDGFYGRNGVADHVIKEKIEEATEEIPEIFYDPMQGADEETSVRLDKRPTTPIAMSSRQHGVFQRIYELLGLLEEKEE